MPQLKIDIKKEFSKPIVYQELDYKPIELNDFLDVTVKGAYDSVPEINYPLVTILEIQNTENSKFTDNNGEHVSDLSYQIESLSRDTTQLQATESAMLMGKVINNLLTGQKYKLSRVGTPAIAPLPDDKNIIRYIQTYSCSIDLDTNTIYARS